MRLDYIAFNAPLANIGEFPVNPGADVSGESIKEPAYMRSTRIGCPARVAKIESDPCPPRSSRPDFDDRADRVDHRDSRVIVPLAFTANFYTGAEHDVAALKTEQFGGA